MFISKDPNPYITSLKISSSSLSLNSDSFSSGLLQCLFLTGLLVARVSSHGHSKIGFVYQKLLSVKDLVTCQPDKVLVFTKPTVYSERQVMIHHKNVIIDSVDVLQAEEGFL